MGAAQDKPLRTLFKTLQSFRFHRPMPHSSHADTYHRDEFTPSLFSSACAPPLSMLAPDPSASKPEHTSWKLFLVKYQETLSREVHMIEWIPFSTHLLFSLTPLFNDDLQVSLRWDSPPKQM